MAKKKNQSNNNEKQSGGGNKENGGGVVVVLKVDLHCEGCAGRVVKAVRSVDGVESVTKGDNESKKITVIGNLDPVKLRQKVEEKTKKKVELISPATKTDNDGEINHQSGGGGERKKQQKQHRQEKATAVKDQNEPKELPVTTAVLKVPLHCRGCIRKIHRLVGKTKGFMEISFDKSKDLVTVKGGIDVKVLAAALKDKLKRNVEIVTPKKEGGGGGGEKKGKGGGGGGGGEGEEGGGGGGGGGGKAEGHKMEYYGGQGGYPYPQYVYEPCYMVNYVHPPQLFSDENPNACAVM